MVQDTVELAKELKDREQLFLNLLHDYTGTNPQLIQHAGVIVGNGGWTGHSQKGLFNQPHGCAGHAMLASKFSAITGAFMTVQKKLFDRVSSFDAVNSTWPATMRSPTAAAGSTSSRCNS